MYRFQMYIKILCWNKKKKNKKKEVYKVNTELLRSLEDFQ